MNWKAFSELLANWEFQEEGDPIRTVCDVVRLTHLFINSREDWEAATQSDFLRYADTVAAAVNKRNASQQLTADEQRTLTAWDDAGIAPLSKQWDTIPEFRRIQFDDGRIQTACQLLSRIQRYENAGQSERQDLLLSIGFLSARLVRLQNRIVDDRAAKGPARDGRSLTPSGTRKPSRLRPVSRHKTGFGSSATRDAREAFKRGECEMTKPVDLPTPKIAEPALAAQGDREAFARVLQARDHEASVSRNRRIPEDELRAVLANPAPGKTPLLAAASHFGVSTKTIRWRAAEYGIDL